MIDWTKPIQTHHGHSARVICQNRKSKRLERTVIVLVMFEDGQEEIFSVSPEGNSGSKDGFIINRPEYIWVVYQPDKPLQSFFSEDSARVYFINTFGDANLEATIVRYTVKGGVLTDAKVL